MDYTEFASDIPLDRAVEFTSAEENEETMRELGIEQCVRQLGRGPFKAHIAVASSEEADLYSDRFNKALSMYLEPPKGRVGFAIFRSANGEFLASGRQVANDKLVIVPDGTGTDIVAPDLCGSDDISISQQHFEELADAVCPSWYRPETMTVVEGDTARLHALRNAIVAQVNRPVVSPGDEEIANLVGELIAWIAESTRGARAERVSDHAVKVRLAKIAQEFIEHHYRDGVRTEDLCRVTGVGVRHLQRCFRDYFDVTITEYVKTLRLEKARRELAAARPEENSVTAIALRHGFKHLGRFSVEYRRRFGETPSRTLAEV